MKWPVASKQMGQGFVFVFFVVILSEGRSRESKSLP
jgi:hypothetical protein